MFYFYANVLLQSIHVAELIVRYELAEGSRLGFRISICVAQSYVSYQVHLLHKHIETICEGEGCEISRISKPCARLPCGMNARRERQRKARHRSVTLQVQPLG